MGKSKVECHCSANKLMLVHGWIHETTSFLVGQNREYTIGILHVVKSCHHKVTIGRPVFDGEWKIYQRCISITNVTKIQCYLLSPSPASSLSPSASAGSVKGYIADVLSSKEVSDTKKTLTSKVCA